VSDLLYHFKNCIKYANHVHLSHELLHKLTMCTYKKTSLLTATLLALLVSYDAELASRLLEEVFPHYLCSITSSIGCEGLSTFLASLVYLCVRWKKVDCLPVETFYKPNGCLHPPTERLKETVQRLFSLFIIIISSGTLTPPAECIYASINKMALYSGLLQAFHLPLERLLPPLREAGRCDLYVALCDLNDREQLKSCAALYL
jgi:hypothetical protein